MEDHEILLAKVLRRLHAHGMQLRFDKSDFFVSKNTFLGQVIDAETDVGSTLIRSDPKHVMALLEFPTPTSPASLRRFLGIAVFLQPLLPNYACIAAPLYELTKKDVTWHWSQEHENVFQSLKRILSTEPYVALPNGDDPFDLRVDASAVCLGGALLQRTSRGEKVIAYLSRKFSEAEQRWSTWERELFALVYAVKQYGYLLIGSPNPLTFVSDHKPLQHYKNFRNIDDKVIRWMDILNSVRWEFEYMKGEENSLADALSRSTNVSKSPYPLEECTHWA